MSEINFRDNRGTIRYDLCACGSRKRNNCILCARCRKQQRLATRNTLESIVGKSGPIWSAAKEHDRYIVMEISGFSMEGLALSKMPRSTYAVLDSAYNYTEMAVFVPGQEFNSSGCKRRAYSLCEELNQLDREGDAA